MSETAKPNRLKRWITRALMLVGAFTIGLILLLILVPLLFFRSPSVPGGVVIELDLRGGLAEGVAQDPISALLGLNTMTLRDATEGLELAGTDDRVRGLMVRLSGGALTMAQAEELRDAVESFRESGKPALAFAESFGEFGGSQVDYYFATAFEEIHLQPSGDLGLTGLLLETPFLGGTLDMIGVEPEMGYRYEYKDAVNLFTEEEMTDPQREASSRLLTSWFGNLVDGIARGRGLTAAEVERLIGGGPYTADEAIAAGLVDRLSYRDQVYDSLSSALDDAEYLYAAEYLDRAGRPHRSGPAIALIYGVGAIQTGSSQVDPLAGGTSMGSESLTRAFRDAVDDDAVRAIVFRIDSPGGSYVASDAIWREVERAQEAGKPVIATMGSMAASGGYFVAMGADRIIAQPSTITGSIGVYAGKVVVDELSAHLGVTWDTVQVGGNATMWSITEGFSEAERQRLETNLDRIYNDFVSKAAAGRNLTRDSVHTVARGRIWTGSDALALGLVDELGGLDLAIQRAKEAAGIDSDAAITLRPFPRERSFLELLFEPEETSSYSTGLLGLLAAGELMQMLTAELRTSGVSLQRGTLQAPFIPGLR